MKYPAYPQYKDSGVVWLGEVPGHWDVKRLKMAAHLCDKKVEANEENPLPYIGMENIESWSGKLLPVDPDIVPSGIANYFSIGTTLFGKLRPYLAKACNPDFDGLCSTELLVIQAEDFDRRALLYWLLADGFIKLVDSSTYGSKMPRANWDFIGNCELPVPPLTEQSTIADFLDRETGRIDTLVAKKRKLVELLKEKRSALISRTVTRGLPADAAREFDLITCNTTTVHEAPAHYGRGDFNRPQTEANKFAPTSDPTPSQASKDSGVEWLGEIPNHWVATQLCRISTILDCKHRTVSFTDEGIALASIQEVSGFEIDLSNAKKTTIEEYLIMIDGDRKPRFGDIIYSRNATVGNAAIVTTKVPFCMGQDVCLIRTSNQSSRFFLYQFRSHSLMQQLESLMIGSTFRRINVGQIKGFWVCVPPLEEQTAIAAYLDRETAKIDRLVAKVETAVNRLQEYRSALITAAVTGKIDVRGALQ